MNKNYGSHEFCLLGSCHGSCVSILGPKYHWYWNRFQWKCLSASRVGHFLVTKWMSCVTNFATKFVIWRHNVIHCPLQFQRGNPSHTDGIIDRRRVIQVPPSSSSLRRGLTELKFSWTLYGHKPSVRYYTIYNDVNLHKHRFCSFQGPWFCAFRK